MEEDHCAYCDQITKPADGPVTKSPNGFNQVLASGPSVVITPTVGMLLPGYLLAVTKEHMYSFAELNKTELDRLQQWIEQLLDALKPEFGSYFVFEHGSSRTSHAQGARACIEHAHWHLIPLPSAGRSARGRLKELREVETLADIRAHAGLDYALISSPSGWLLAPEPHLPSQWIRKIAANELGIELQYDWALFPRPDNLQETLQRLDSIDLPGA